MRADDLRTRRRLDVAFGLLLASGLTVVVVCLLATGNWMKPQGEGAFGLYLLGMFSFAPTALAWLACGLQMFLAPRDRDARLGAALATGHLGWWLAVLGLGTWLDEPLTGWIVRVILAEPGVYGLGATYLAARWFRRRGRE
jgi:hypothetical protein